MIFWPLLADWRAQLIDNRAMIRGGTMGQVYRVAICVLFFIAPASLSVSAGPFEDGVAAYRDQHYVSAMNFWRPLAEAGDTRAQANIGVLYRDAQGVPHGREVLAYMWFSLAAAGGNKGAERERDVLARSMPAAQVADAKKLVSNWKPKGAVTAGPWK